MEPKFILVGTIVFLGLGYHFIFLAQSDDLHSPFQRAFPFIYWLLTGVGIMRGVSLIDSTKNNVMITISLSVAAVMIGIVVGHIIARGLRYRVRHPGEDVYRELFEDEGRSGRGHSTF